MVTFLGTTTLPGIAGQIYPTQPLFHVQHGVEGTEDQPLNTWRIVNLTSEINKQLLDRFNSVNNSTTLPGYIEAYIKNDLNVTVSKK